MLRLVLNEHRTFLIVLAAVLAANVVVYLLLVYPLATSVSQAQSQVNAAEAARRSAEREQAAARGLAVGKNHAEQELQKFYQEILPADLGGANRATYLTIAQIAQKANLRVVRRQAAPAAVQHSSLKRFNVSIVLEGSYEQIRDFVYGLETAPQFVVIDSMAIQAARDAGAAGSLVLTLELSTYYQAGNDGI